MACFGGRTPCHRTFINLYRHVRIVQSAAAFSKPGILRLIANPGTLGLAITCQTFIRSRVEIQGFLPGILEKREVTAKTMLRAFV